MGNMGYKTEVVIGFDSIIIAPSESNNTRR